MMIKCNLGEYNEYSKKQATLGLNETEKQLNKKENIRKKKERSKKQVANENKCSICDLNSKELNSFKCHECSHLFHKQCVSKRTSPEEFSLLKKGDVMFDCENCISNRRGIVPLRAINFTELIMEMHKEASIKEIEGGISGIESIEMTVTAGVSNTESY